MEYDGVGHQREEAAEEKRLLIADRGGRRQGRDKELGRRAVVEGPREQTETSRGKCLENLKETAGVGGGKGAMEGGKGPLVRVPLLYE